MYLHKFFIFKHVKLYMDVKYCIKMSKIIENLLDDNNHGKYFPIIIYYTTV